MVYFDKTLLYNILNINRNEFSGLGSFGGGEAEETSLSLLHNPSRHDICAINNLLHIS